MESIKSILKKFVVIQVTLTNFVHTKKNNSIGLSKYCYNLRDVTMTPFLLKICE